MYFFGCRAVSQPVMLPSPNVGEVDKLALVNNSTWLVYETFNVSYGIIVWLSAKIRIIR